jgi:hypothetical protein
MTNHNAACLKSPTLCDQLFEALQRKIPGLQIKYNDNLCSIWSTGAVIAWASPIMIWGGIRVWFIGESQNMKKFQASTLPLKIKPILGMWGDSCGSFQISNNAQIEAATELLFTVSYPLSITWLSNDVGNLKDQRPPSTKKQTRSNRPWAFTQLWHSGKHQG